MRLQKLQAPTDSGKELKLSPEGGRGPSKFLEGSRFVFESLCWLHNGKKNLSKAAGDRGLDKMTS